jgi:spermidine synthase
VSFWRDSQTVWSHAVASEPTNLTARHELALALFDLGRDDEAAAQFRIAHKIDPTYIANCQMISRPVTRIRDRQAAEIAAYREALRRQPDSIDIRSKLAWRLATSPVQSLRNADEAIRMARRADELSGGGRTDVLDALAAGYAEAGRFGDAAVAARKALGLAVRQNLTRLAAEIGARRRLYEDHQPFHEPLTPADNR